VLPLVLSITPTTRHSDTSVSNYLANYLLTTPNSRRFHLWVSSCHAKATPYVNGLHFRSLVLKTSPCFTSKFCYVILYTSPSTPRSISATFLHVLFLLCLSPSSEPSHPLFVFRVLAVISHFKARLLSTMSTSSTGKVLTEKLYITKRTLKPID
jgi:hypothetical protein